jgi:hypothetical protein
MVVETVEEEYNKGDTLEGLDEDEEGSSTR